MHSSIWLAYAALCGPALAATVPRTLQGQDSLTTSPLSLIFSGNVSAAITNTSELTSPSVNSVPEQLLNFSFTYDLPSRYNLTAANGAIPQCSGPVYGSDLDRLSCFDAWRNMGLSPDRASWGPRGTATSYQYRLPSRWSSGMAIR